jgi:ribonuclease P protein component
MVADPSLDEPRMAFAIGRTAGTAVKRNRARRRLREVLRQHESEMGPGLYLWGLTRPAGSVTFEELSAAVPVIMAKLSRS